MMLKVFKSIWFLSLLAVLAVLLYVYASLPEQVMIQEEATGIVYLSREAFFYAVTGLVALVNVLVYIIAKMFRKQETFRAWFHGLIVTLNIFFIIGLSFINVFNSNERFDYGRIGFVIYGSVALIIAWAAAWPFYSLYRKISTKPTI